MPVMWPGVITAGLFSLMLAYNDFTVTALLLNQENHTMVPKIQSYLGTNQHEGNLMWAVFICCFCYSTFVFTYNVFSKTSNKWLNCRCC